MMLPELNRRQILKSAALSALSGTTLTASSKPVPKGEAEHCIFLWLGGGAAQMDTFDPKRKGMPRVRKLAPTTTRSIPQCPEFRSVSTFLVLLLKWRTSLYAEPFFTTS